MSNAAKFETPDAADNGKTYVYNSGTDAHAMTDMATQAELDAHDIDTTSVHGITDTATLYRSGGTDVAVADGGTGSSTAAGARTALGLVIGTDVQAQDAELAAIAGLTSAADAVPYFTGSGAAALATVTAAARTVLDDANTAAMLTTLGAQPADTDLTAIAALISAADKVPYSTGAGSWALADLTAAGRALLDDANTAAMLTTLGAQPADTDLTAIAALTSAADKVPYSTGAGSWALADLTAAGRALLDDAAATNQRTTLGLVIGTDVQAQDAELAAIAGLTSAADRLPYFTGSGAAALATFTTAGRNLVDDADAAAQRVTIAAVDRANGGLETAATNASATGAVTVNLANGNHHHLTLTGAVTLTLSGATTGFVCSLTLLLTQDATGGRAITWPAAVKWLPGGSAPTFTTTLSTRSIVQMFTIDGGTTWFAALAGSGIA